MLKKVSLGKGASIVLVISMVGMGAPSLPSALAAGEDTAQTVTLTAQAASSNALSNLQVEGVTFDQGDFSPNTFNYTATVENNVKSISLQTGTENNENITITVNGQTVDNGNDPIQLQTGVNQIAIKVDDGTNPANTYNLTITRKNLLQDLQLSSGELSPKFDAATTSYTAQVANDATEITVDPVASENDESITVNGADVTDKGVTVQLPTDKTDITIVATAENGDKVTYTLEVTKAASTTGDTGSSSSGTGTSSNGTGSSSDTGSSSSGTGSSSDTSSTSSGSGSSSNTSSTAKRTGSSGRTGTAATSGGSRYAGSMTAASFISTSSYGSRSGNLAGVQQTGATVQPSKATLSALTVTAGTWNKTFAKDTFTYHIAVGSDVDTVAIDGTATYSDSTITVNGSADNTVSLGDQAKTIVPIVVTNGSDKKTYILVFDKAVPQAVATTANNQTTSNTDNQVTDTSIQNSNSSQAQNNWSGRNNNGTTNTSFWSRLIDGIRSFFSKL